ncbi:mitochondrial ribosomal protein MRP51 [Staphylotrichum tortipilum]|uniref:Mitochondrial ribosomal protein MRP51 n=1 Tax=Staphylotrichum tortipilum TaxID=2831512 RepID=A0AAN6MC85_9PEZI|nr:mitochondrial ribosomal protein MRP51 [Staphylotrichum longicolle]
MSTRSMSPGGALLRASRMFSLPAPLPAPKIDQGASIFHSETAMLPYPTHQVITTLNSSRERGDWGLKRPLPLRSTTKSTHPMLRVKAVDTAEQITDYASAADHGMTLKKFQELNMPVTILRTAGGGRIHTNDRTNVPRMSAFEDKLDKTHIPASKRAAAVEDRWRFEGPWLAGMSQGDFKTWLAEEVRPKRSQFRRFLKKKLAKEMSDKAAGKALDKAQELPDRIKAGSITDDQVTDYVRHLRTDNQALFEMVGEFLDLAPLKPPKPSHSAVGSQPVGSKFEFRDVNSPWAESGPPITHPSAGLSYLRTSMFLTNHPIYGPQMHQAAAEARILRLRRPGQVLGAKYGLAGFVVDAPMGDTSSNRQGQTVANLETFDPNLKGGAKTWVQPQSVLVNSSGHIMITVGDATPEVVLVTKELLGDAVCLDAPFAGPAEETASDLRARYKAADPPSMSSAEQYGL